MLMPMMMPISPRHCASLYADEGQAFSFSDADASSITLM